MAKVEERVLAAPAGKTADELARVARDALKRLDPAGSQRRAKEARDQADVEFYPDPDGDVMGDVVIHAPIEDATVVKTGVDAYAATLKASGDPRPIGVLRAEAPAKWASDYLTGGSGGASAPRGGGRPVEIGITPPLRPPPRLGDPPRGPPRPGVIPRTVNARVN